MTSIELSLKRTLTDVLEDELYHMKVRNEQSEVSEFIPITDVPHVNKEEQMQPQMFNKYADPSVTMIPGVNNTLPNIEHYEDVKSMAPAMLSSNINTHTNTQTSANANANANTTALRNVMYKDNDVFRFSDLKISDTNDEQLFNESDAFYQSLGDEKTLYYDDPDYFNMGSKMEDWQLEDNSATLNNNDARMIFDNEFADDDDLSDDENLFDDGFDNNTLHNNNQLHHGLESDLSSEFEESSDEKVRKYHLDNIQNILNRNNSLVDNSVLQVKLPSEFTTIPPNNTHEHVDSNSMIKTNDNNDNNDSLLQSVQGIEPTMNTNIQLPDLAKLGSLQEAKDILLVSDSDEDELYSTSSIKETKKSSPSPVDKVQAVTKSNNHNHTHHTHFTKSTNRKLSSTRKQTPKVHHPKAGSRGSHTKSNANHETFVCELVNMVTNEVCGAQFSRTYDLTRHQNTIHAKRRTIFRCSECIRSLGDEGFQKTFSRLDALTRHIKAKHENLSVEERQEVTQYAKANIGFVSA
ncbi:Protein RPN4 [Nakaseomyces bracarensis]|uniref:Protein RPN4 n=1 Tax=Nakaseomyces bracarensis TaxID=273131 RepID=A0ABR4NWQ5_9SACH